MRSKGPLGDHVILCLLVLSPRVKRYFLLGHVSVPRPGMFRILYGVCGFGAKIGVPYSLDLLGPLESGKPPPLTVNDKTPPWAIPVGAHFGGPFLTLCALLEYKD